MGTKAENPRESLRVSQHGSVLTIVGVYNKVVYVPDTVVLVDRDTRMDVASASLEIYGSAFDVTVDLAVHGVDPENTLDVYLEGSRRDSGARRRQRLGRFTETHPVSVDDGVGLTPYFTMMGNLSLSDERTRPSSATLATRSLTFSQGHLSLSATLETHGAPVVSASLLLEARDGIEVMRFPVDVESRLSAVDSYGLHTYSVRVKVDVDNIADGVELSPIDVLDAFLEVETEWNTDQLPRIRINAPLYRERRRIRSHVIRRGSSVVVVLPYFTVNANRLAIRVERFDSGIYDYMKRVGRAALLYRVAGALRGTWLIGEMPYRARGNGASFFRYVRTQHPGRRAFYVIDPDAPDAERVASLGNVVAFRSKEHVRLSVEAKRLVGTHHFEYLMPAWDTWFTKHVRGVRVFLQHGVMGTKNMVPLYGVGKGLFADHFLVSSMFEKEMIVNDFGYRPSQVAVTGLVRFDDLLSEVDEPGRRVLVIPTFRDWLFTEGDLLTSEYLEQWRLFLDDPRLREHLDASDITMTLVLHPNMRRFTSLFKTDGVDVLTMDDSDLQPLMKTSSLLITDYSSIAFDFSFLDRPVLYFMFDRRRFLTPPSHLDIFSDLPGEIVSTPSDLVDATLQAVESGFAVDPEFARRSEVFLDYRDTNVGERAYAVVKGARRKVHVWNRLARSDLGQTVAKIYRGGDYFSPSMKLLFRLARTMPFKRSVLFESSLGRQYSGNPKYLYERLVARGESANTVWVLGNTTRMKDPTTRKVARNTPGFYWRLGRAKAWITDQHFPHGLKPSRGTALIQTWHGTPLKRLLFDQDQIVGQPDDYVDKTVKRLAYWDVMIAQSERAAGFFRSAFRFTCTMLVTGYPRNDILVRNDPDDAALIRRRLGIPAGKRVVLYAPTFRDDERQRVGWSHKMVLDLEEFARQLGGEFFLLVRTHLFVRNDRRVERVLEGFGADVSGYDDISELLLISDVLVTDYSSVMFDFAATGKPMVFFAYDLEHYRDDLRGFYLDYEKDVPGPIVRTSDDVIEMVGSVDAWRTDYAEPLERFRDQYCPDDDGTAADRAITQLKEGGWI